MTSKNSKVDQKMFDCVKILLRSGETQTKISDYMGISSWTVNRINAAQTLEEYRNMVIAAAANRSKSKQANTPAPEPAQPQEIIREVRQNVTVQTTHFTMQKLDKMIELLQGISAKLAFIVDELTGDCKKEGN